MASNNYQDEVFKEKRKPKNPIKFKIPLNEEQKQAKEEVLNNTVILLQGIAGSGKAQDLDSLVITPNGSKRIGDIKPGDFVISEEGKPVKVLNIYPQGTKDIYKITFSDGSTANCCEEHLWNVIKRSNLHRKYNRTGSLNINYQKYQTLSLKEIKEKGLLEGKKDKWFIPQQGITQFEPQNVNIDPYILGCLIGDGSLSYSTPILTNKDPELIQYFQTWCDENNLILYPKSGVNKYGEQIEYSITSRKNQSPIQYNTLSKFLKEYNLIGTNSFNKFIPQEYLINDIPTRLGILQGLLDTDEWVQTTKFRTNKGESSGIYFYTTSEQLKNDVVFLVQSLGGVCYVQEKQGKYKAKGEKEYKLTAINYRICINFDNELRFEVFRLSRKKEKITDSKNILNRSISKIEFLKHDEAVCILVDSDSHLYLTNNFIVTHNTILACQIGLDLLFNKEIEKIIITRPTVGASRDIGYLPGDIKDKMDPWLAPIYSNLYTLYDKIAIDKLIEEQKIEILPINFARGRTFVNSFVIVDECQNIDNRETELMIGRLGKFSRMVFCGDVCQIDLINKKNSGISFFKTLESNVKGVKVISLKQNHRHEIVPQILGIYKQYE
jgi:hypothetical protein